MITLDRDLSASAAPATVEVPALADLRPAYCLLGAPLAVVIAGASAAIATSDGPAPVEVVRPVLVTLWAVAGLLLGVRRRSDRLAPIVIGGTLVGAIGTLAAAMTAHGKHSGAAALTCDVAVRLSAALLPVIALHLLLGLADGRLMTPIRRNTVIVGYVIGCAIGLALLTDRERVVVWPTAVLWLAALAVGL